jgi:hypothetical protein
MLQLMHQQVTIQQQLHLSWRLLPIPLWRYLTRGLSSLDLTPWNCTLQDMVRAVTVKMSVCPQAPQLLKTQYPAQLPVAQTGAAPKCSRCLRTMRIPGEACLVGQARAQPVTSSAISLPPAQQMAECLRVKQPQQDVRAALAAGTCMRSTRLPRRQPRTCLMLHCKVGSQRVKCRVQKLLRRWTLS